MKSNLVKVHFDKPSKMDYLWQSIRTIFSLTYWKYWISRHSYIVVNCITPRRQAQIGKTSNVHPTVVLRQAERIQIGEHCLINHNNVFQAGKKDGKIILGNYVHTGPGVMMFAFNHSIDDVNIPSKLQDYYEGDIVIEDDVWIGAGSIILAGVKIGKGSVVASNCVVNKDIPPYSVVGGVPVKIIRSRI